CGFDTAGQRPGRSANEHEDDDDKDRGVGQMRGVDGVESGGAAGNREEACVEDVAPIVGGGAAGPFKGGDQHSASEEQYDSHVESDARVVGKTGAPSLPAAKARLEPMAKIDEDKEADATQNDENYDDEINCDVIG